ncbi:SANT/Myb-like DNA-binding domain-containing protein [Flagellimonas lutaonensis]|uniref:Uncharacterized protein n=1 Tax=Flagellimonas lutaonensis TaxID=516051 RepID=A0A0D5YUM2_9FLAO|nr:SANT/Myb-like DNA-binding domain-containing protein [Allomuricauda lutaonensis]AKA36017.1 hypothetical protein VC82_2439 [Allomuricauda lutaonensis]
MFERRRAYNPKKAWSKNEEEKLLNHLKSKGFNSKILQKMFPDRTMASIRSKTRKLRIKHDIFGESYRETKKDFTKKHAEIIKPESVFEAYCGTGHQTIIWEKYCNNIFASDKDKNKRTPFINAIKRIGYIESSTYSDWLGYKKEKKNICFYNGDVLNAAIEIKQDNIKIDVLDLDTCGSTLPILPMLINLIKPKFLFITHGEFHSMRFKRDDVLRRVLFHRDINDTCLDLTVDELSKELDKAVKISALRSHNETQDSYWAELIDEVWLGSKFHGMLRRVYKIIKAPATSDCLNELLYQKF